MKKQGKRIDPSFTTMQIICKLLTKNLVFTAFITLVSSRYGYAQCQFLPTRNFRFEKVTKELVKKVLSTSKNSSRGYILECDLTYPEKLHEKHRNFPLCPEKMEISPDMLSDFQRRCHKQLGTKAKASTKLVASFGKRVKYVIHYENLKLYLKLGMKLTKVHRILSFDQEPFLKKFIDFCTEMRQKATSSLEKNFFKLISNSCYGKTIENPSKYLNVSFVTDRKKLRQCMTDPYFHSFKIISKSLVLIFTRNKKVVIRQPCAVGFTILELSKQFMYDSFYKHIQPAFGAEECQVCFSDTDSLFLSVPFSKNPHKKIQHILDASNFDPSHPLYDESRKSALGYFKSETGSNKILKFVGLRSKVYAFQTEKGLSKKCKGISKNYRKQIPFSSYERCISAINCHRQEQYTLSSKSHRVSLVKSTKLAFSSFDDKTYLLPGGIHSLPYYSSEIVKNEKKCQFCCVK